MAGNTFRTKIAYLYGQEERTELYEISIPSRKDGEILNVASATITYEDALTKEKIVREVDIDVQYSDNKRDVEAALNKDVMIAVAKKRTAEAQEAAIKLADAGDYIEAAKQLTNNSSKLENTARLCNNDAELRRMAEQQRDLSESIISNQGMTNDLRKGEVMNQVFEYWGN